MKSALRPAATARPAGASRTGWVTAFARSPLGRDILRRLPARLRRWVWATRRWQRRLSARIRSRWHRSLQVRVVTTTLVLSAVVIAVLGFFLVQAIASGLLASAERVATRKVENAVALAKAQSSVNVLGQPSKDSSSASSFENVMLTTVNALKSENATGSYYLVRFIGVSGKQGFPAYVPWAGPNNIDAEQTVPQALKTTITTEQTQSTPSTAAYVAPSRLVQAAGSGSGSPQPVLVAGAPLGAYYQVYYVQPLSDEQAMLHLMQKAMIGVALALVALLAAIASLVTRWVVIPVRHAAESAQRLSEGHLDERMRVEGSDDLARLATSFNEMAGSLADKLHQLEELSKVQRQFVSDVSHELRTPLSTIKMAAEVLDEARETLDPAAIRSLELLQSQLERFEELLVDLLEISRYDARAATLDVDLVDICDLARRSADDAQQLAERLGCRIEFRLPAEGCFAEVDRRRVERILRNLLVNAVEHGEGRDVVVTAAVDSDAVAVAVRDFGVGLRPGEEQLVFDRFWRADPARARTSGGTGLGLAISLEDARLHGGWLQAWGQPGKGSVFRLTLPREAGQPLAGSPLGLEPGPGEIASSLTVGGGGQASAPDLAEERARS